MSRAPESRREIEAAIPHRDPFLFVDAIEEQSADGLRTSWLVPPDGSWFEGHYPGEPVLPGVLISEHVFQSAALLVSQRLGGFDPRDGIPVLTKIEGARFKRIVRPGECLTTEVSLREELGGAYFLSGHTSCGKQTVLRIRFVLTASAALSTGPGASRHGARSPQGRRG